MFKQFFNSCSVAFLFAVSATFSTTQAHAVQRTHVSAAFGNDANTATNCTAAAPCRFFQAALTVTDNNGEVIVLDSGGYGAVTITKSVALIAPTGVYAGISVFSGANGVTIATPNIKVVLRGLTINGQGGNNGISMSTSAGSKLSVENCVVSNMANSGITAAGSSTVLVVDSTFRSNAANGIYLTDGVSGTIARNIVSANGNAGIFVEGNAASTSTLVDIADTTVDTSYIGIVTSSTSSTATIRASVRDSRVVRNREDGILAQSLAGAAVLLNASNNIVSNNLYGLSALNAGAIAVASGNTVTGNLGGGFYNTAVIKSAGNNTVDGNGPNVGTITVITQQ